jgi:hypothetical protein
MKEIPLYHTFSKIGAITKGMSGDKKYYIETADGKHMLLILRCFHKLELCKSSACMKNNEKY